MKIASATEMQAQFPAYLKHSETSPVVVTKKGRPVAMLVAVQNQDDLEEALLAQSPRLRAILDKSRRQIAAGQWLSHEDFWKQAESKTQPRKSSRRVRRKAAAPTK
jgi:prevent-host-death family protein